MVEAVETPGLIRTPHARMSVLWRAAREEISGIHWNGELNRGIRVVMPKKPKAVPMEKPFSPVRPRSVGVLRDQIIVRIGPMVFAADYAIKITELKTVTCDPSGRVIVMRKSAPPGQKPDSPA